MGEDWLEKSIKQSVADWKKIATQVKVKKKQEFSNLTKPQKSQE
jgi:phosphodiesterase/alkaline phosphatase D-like protein